MEVDNIEQYKQKYPNEWVVVRIEEEDEDGNILRSSLLAHSDNREQMEGVMCSIDDYTYIFFTGPVIPAGEAVAI